MTAPLLLFLCSLHALSLPVLSDTLTTHSHHTNQIVNHLPVRQDISNSQSNTCVVPASDASTDELVTVPLDVDCGRCSKDPETIWKCQQFWCTCYPGSSQSLCFLDYNKLTGAMWSTSGDLYCNGLLFLTAIQPMNCSYNIDKEYILTAGVVNTTVQILNNDGSGRPSIVGDILYSGTYTINIRMGGISNKLVRFRSAGKEPFGERLDRAIIQALAANNIDDADGESIIWDLTRKKKRCFLHPRETHQICVVRVYFRTGGWPTG